MMKDQLFDINNIHESYKKGIIPKEIVTEVYNRIEKVNDNGIFIYLQSIEDIFKDLDSLGEMNFENKPLWGIPFTVKDNIDVKGIPTTAACSAFEYIAKEDAFVVKLLKEAGAICIGKTNLDQFATGLVGTRSPFEIPKNAIDSNIIPGGSSSGSAVAVSHQIVTFSLGTDTAGSGRVPATLNNIVGLKPTLGALSKRGVVPACLTLDTVSIFALHLDDAYNIFNVLCKYDKEDPYSKPKPKIKNKNPKNLVIAIPDKNSQIFFDDDIQKESYLKTVEDIKKAGFKMIEIDMEPFFKVANLLYEGSWVAERYSVIEDLIKNKPNEILEVTRNIIKKAENFSSSDVFQDLYKLNALKREIEFIVKKFDVLCVPSIPKVFSVQDIKDEPVKANSELGTYTNFVNLLDLSAVALPVNKRKDNFASGITLIGKSFKELELINVAKKMQENMSLTYGNSSIPLKLKNNDLIVSDNQMIDIAIVGVHLTGMPLNKDLLDLDAQFLISTKTSAKYKLYKLEGTKPVKPGLIQCNNGVSIDLEIWSMPIENMGEFEKTISKPLCIGTIELEDGTFVKGFLCESYVLEKAEDISHFSGFRAYINSEK